MLAKGIERTGTAVHRCIDIKRNLGVAAGGLAEAANILGVIVGHEDLVGIDVIAEDLSPGGLVAGAR